MKETFEGATAVRPNPRIKKLSCVVMVLGLLIGVAAIELGPELLVAAVVLVGLAGGLRRGAIGGPAGSAKP